MIILNLLYADCKVVCNLTSLSPVFHHPLQLLPPYLTAGLPVQVRYSAIMSKYMCIHMHECCIQVHTCCIHTCCIWKLLHPQKPEHPSSMENEKRAAQVRFKPTTHCLRGRHRTHRATKTPFTWTVVKRVETEFGP